MYCWRDPNATNIYVRSSETTKHFRCQISEEIGPAMGEKEIETVWGFGGSIRQAADEAKATAKEAGFHPRYVAQAVSQALEEAYEKEEIKV